MEHERDSFLSKAQESLASAESDFEGARYNSCSYRCYYACFQATVSALLHDGIRPRDDWGHEYVQVQFTGQLIHRRKRYAADLRGVLVDNLRLRLTADYGTKTITHTQARRAVTRSRSFVGAIGARVRA